uniref:NR LBD domain-containing protein n=1 Tax=Panagrolaimus sp. ES5 TaxID=591445 RepID=A0AC34FAK0_9BILA
MVKEVVRCGPLQGRRGRMPSKARTSMLLSDSPQDSPSLPILTLISKYYSESRPLNRPQQCPHPEPVPVKQVLDIMDFEIKALYSFLMKVPDIKDINPNDMQQLLYKNFFPLFAMKHAHRIGEMKLENAFMFDNGQTLSLNNIPNELLPFFNAIQQESPLFNAVDWDLQSFATVLVLKFLDYEDDRNTIIDQTRIHQIHSTIINALKDHCCAVQNPSDNKLSKILSQGVRFNNYRNLGFTSIYRCIESGNEPPPILAQLYQNFCKQSMSSSTGGKMQSGMLSSETIMQQSGANEKMSFPF